MEQQMQRQALKKFVPATVWKAGSDAYWWWYNRGRHVMAQLAMAPIWRENLNRIRAYHNRYQGQRCFIIGNGPSLRQTDLTKLKGEITFGLNRIYLAFPELGFTTSYLVSVNDLVMEQCAGDIEALKMPRFVTWRARSWLKAAPELMFLDTDYTGPEVFSGDAAGRLFEGFTVTFMALQLAYYMGFSRVVLIGVDHNFTTQGPANATITSQGDDPNHFTPNYFGKGFRWQLPDLPGSERAYRLAKQAFEADGRLVLDATVGGKLTVFPKIDYLSLF
jgi:hypothetical protein